MMKVMTTRRIGSRAGRMALLMTIILLIGGGCASKPASVTLPADAEFERSQAYLEARKYNRAIQGFERIIFYHPTSEFVDDAQYWLAQTYTAMEDYAQAITEFEYLIKNFPASQFLEDAYFFRAVAYLKKAPGPDRDQTETADAIGYLDEFLTRFPNSPHTNDVRGLILEARNRLAKKELDNAKLYLKLKEPKAAELYFTLYVIEAYPETPAALEAKYHLAGLYARQGKTDEALALYEELQSSDIWRDRAQTQARKLKNEQ